MFGWTEWLLSWLLAAAHAAASAVAGPDSGVGWVVAVVVVAVTVRAVLLPMYVQQVDMSATLTVLRGYTEQVRAAVPHDRRARNLLVGQAYREAGVRRWALWVPLLVQLPVLMGLYRLLADAIGAGVAVGGMTAPLVASARQATLFGVPLTVSVATAGDDRASLVAASAVGLLIALTVFSAVRALRRTVGRSAPVQARRLAVAGTVTGLCVYGWAVPLGLLTYSVTSAAITAGLSLWAARRLRRAAPPRLVLPDLPAAA